MNRECSAITHSVPYVHWQDLAWGSRGHRGPLWHRLFPWGHSTQYSTEDGTGILMDFGLRISAKDARHGQGIGDGTPEYAAPETDIRGWNISAEIYSVFVCLTEAVVGRCPFSGKVYHAFGRCMWQDAIDSELLATGGYIAQSTRVPVSSSPTRILSGFTSRRKYPTP